MSKFKPGDNVVNYLGDSGVVVKVVGECSTIVRWDRHGESLWTHDADIKLDKNRPTVKQLY